MTRAWIAAVALCTSSIAAADMAAPPPPPVQASPMPQRVQRVRPPQPPPPPIAAIAAVARPLLGTWTCKGVTMVGNGASTPLQATLNVALELDGVWIHAKLVANNAKVDVYRTFDGVAQQWTEMSMASDGAHLVATSTGEANGAWTWAGQEDSQAGSVQRRDYEMVAAPTLKLWGERLLGGEWQKSYEIGCTK